MSSCIMAKFKKANPGPEGYVNVESSRRVKNVVVFGESGVGKSSLINLIAGERVSETSSGALGCTLKYERHLLDIDGQICAIWDTAGLDEASEGAIPAEKAEAYLKQLLQDLTKTNGIDLLVYCVRGSRLRSALLTNYHIFYSAICRKKVPIAIAITGLENQENNMETWWDNNERQFTSLKMLFDSHVCVTTLESSIENANAILKERREESKAAVIKMITNSCRTQQWKPPARSWVETAFSDIRAMLSPSDSPSSRLATIIMCETYRNYQGRQLTRKRSISFQNPVKLSLSLNPLSVRSPISISESMSRSKLPFENGIKRTPGRQFRVYQVSECMEEETENVPVIKRGADLLIFCVRMDEADSGDVKSKWEYFNYTYGGDLSPQIVVIDGAVDQSSAEEWWKVAVDWTPDVKGVHVTYLPQNAADKNRVAERLQDLINNRCIDFSKVTPTRSEQLFRGSLYLDMSSLTSLWGKTQNSQEDGTPASEQDILTELGVWEEVPERSPLSPTSLVGSRQL